MKNLNLTFSLLATVLTFGIHAQTPGDSDATFDTDGTVVTPIGTGEDVGWSAAVQADGKIVVAGYSDNATDPDFVVVRYNTNGTLDNSFSTGGIVTTPIGTGTDKAFAVAIQPDGKIVVAGYTEDAGEYDFAVVRYNADGTLDNSFSTDGKVTTSFSASQDIAWAVMVQPDGKIVAAGYAGGVSDLDFALVRYNADGTLDTGFDTDGKVITNIGVGDDLLYGAALQSDGKIVVAGGANTASMALARYNPDGSLDNTFSSDGKEVHTVAISSSANAVAVQADGRIVVAGNAWTGSDTDFGLARYNTDGSLDNTFSTDGQVTTAIGLTEDHCHSVAIQPDGKIVLRGYSSNGTDVDFALARYNADGTLDNGFDTDGTVITAIGQSNDIVRSVIIQPDGKIVTAGYLSNLSDYDIAVARYISGLNVGILDLRAQTSSALISPNPISESALLEYELTQPEIISIHLLDMKGTLLHVFVEDQKQEIGKHSEQVTLAEGIPSGNYLLNIKSETGNVAVQIVKR